MEGGIEETLAYYAFPEEHWRSIRTNNPLERILREIRRRTRVVGAFPDGQSALNLAAARLRHIAGTEWSTKRYLSMDFLKDHQLRTPPPEPQPAPLSRTSKCEKLWTLPMNDKCLDILLADDDRQHGADAKGHCND